MPQRRQLISGSSDLAQVVAVFNAGAEREQ
jgi:hypothetical protein